jgi:C-terminal processing protease CtpA/Prc
MVFSKRDDDSRFDYQQPVVILMDEGCFSATDIFLGAFKNWPNVTLMGQPSGGGSARTQTFRLPNSGISVRCASMASFQPDGKLYDTNGIQPDVLVSRSPEYFLAQGEDVILKKAISFLKERKRE